MKYLYLYINLFTILVPFIFSFHKRLQFHLHFFSFLKASVLVAIPFILWDGYFTSLGVWGFNGNYISGIKLYHLPIEEVLFFICIPFSCVFTYHCLLLFFNMKWEERTEKIVITTLVLFLFITGIIYLSHLYTSVTFISLAILLLILKFYIQVKWLPSFLSVYLVLLIPFSIVNGILTGTGLDSPVVWYNESHIMGLRLMTIPVEDVFYGLELLLLNVFFYHQFLDKKANKENR
ncbi:MAG: lycopene cyclase domain-containing protein [Bacteroidetes bacterium]|nr:lycopene cyclase domain-containing protein [Bacteroidota bacterium]